MSTDINRYYWTNRTQSLKLMNPIHRPFPNLILTETCILLVLMKFVISLVTDP